MTHSTPPRPEDYAAGNVLETVMARFNVLGVVAKRTYRLEAGSRCALAPQQLGLLAAPEHEGQLLVADSDLYAFKPAADVVIKGRAHAQGGRPVPELSAGVDLAGRSVRLRVSGPRQVRLKQETISFSPPEPFTSVELTYANAYGGVDRWARPRLDADTILPIQPYVQHPMDEASLALYRRNAAGKGFVVRFTPEMDGMELPQVEDPDDLLTAERLVAAGPNKWHRQPLPAGMDWFDYGWFPRSAYLGFGVGNRPDLPGPEDPTPREIVLGYVPHDTFERDDIRDAVTDRIMNGASPPLIFDELVGDEPITLHNMDPEHPRFHFELPGERPAFTIRPLTEEAREAAPVLATVLVDKEAALVTMVWTGRVQCKYPHGPQQLEKVEFSVRW